MSSARNCLVTSLTLLELPLASLSAATLDEDVSLQAHSDVGWNLHYLESIPRDAADTLIAPAHWGWREWSITAGLAGAGLALYASDGRINSWAQRHRNARSDRIAKDIMPFGTTYIIYELGALGVASPFVSDQRVARTALLGGESVAFAMLGYEVLQLAGNRSRPSQGANRDTWGGPSWPNRGHSFPSGHATAAFAVATVVADEWHAVPGVAPVAYALATAVAAARVDVNAHWASDVFAGAVLGWAMGTGVERCHLLAGSRAQLTPLFDGSREGVAVAWQW